MFFAAAFAITQPAFGVLVFSKTDGFRHDSIPVGIETLAKLGEANNFTTTATEDSATFTSENLSKYKVIVFLNTTGDVLDPSQQDALQNYINKGGGYVGIHAAADTEYDWPWYGELVGGYFKSHPHIQQATVQVLDQKHISTAHLPKSWTRSDEWYDYKALPPAKAKILAKLDTSTYQGHTMGENHPIAWYQTIEKGRSWYTGMGHTQETYADPDFQKHVLGGILWAAKVKN